MLADAISVCTFTNCVERAAADTDEVRRTYFACQRQHCLPMYGGCFSGKSHGAGTCATLAACLGDCDASGEPLCERGCVAAASQGAADAWYDWSLCERSACYASGATAAAGAACAEAARTGACADAATACFGPAGIP